MDQRTPTHVQIETQLSQADEDGAFQDHPARRLLRALRRLLAAAVGSRQGRPGVQANRRKCRRDPAISFAGWIARSAPIATTPDDPNPRSPTVAPTSNDPNPKSPTIATTSDNPNPRAFAIATTSNDPNPKPSTTASTSNNPNPRASDIATTSDNPNPRASTTADTSDDPNPGATTIAVSLHHTGITRCTSTNPH